VADANRAHLNEEYGHNSADGVTKVPPKKGLLPLPRLRLSEGLSINPMNGRNVSPKSEAWLFGENWPGERCGAKTRAGAPCRKAALTGKRRCQLHGGRAGAPPGERNGNYYTGEYTQERKARDRAQSAELRLLIALGRRLGLFR
jgi:hypothetical protein